MGTTTFSTLKDMLSQAIGDYLQFDTSTNLTTASTAKIIATTLDNYDMAQDDYYNEWWTYITEGNNSGKTRKVSDYISTANTLKLYGSALSAESSAVTCQLHRFDPRNKVRAIQRAIEHLYPSLYKPVDDMTIITGNYCPDASFEWWTSSSAMKLWSASNATLARTSTAGYVRNGTYSCKVTNTAANGYVYISSDTYPRLLDLMGRTIDVYCWALPEVANDPAIVIYTKQADGTAQTLTSITTAPAGEYTLLQLTDQALNDNLVEVQIRLKVLTNAKYAYFDDLWIGDGSGVDNYLLPSSLQVGTVTNLRYQDSGYSDIPAYDIQARNWPEREFEVVNDGTYRYIKPVENISNWRRLRLKGYTRLESLSSDTDTISLDGERLNLIVYYAAHLLYEMEKGVVASEDRSRYEQEAAYWLAKTRMIQPTLMMMRPAATLR